MGCCGNAGLLETFGVSIPPIDFLSLVLVRCQFSSPVYAGVLIASRRCAIHHRFVAGSSPVRRRFVASSSPVRRGFVSLRRRFASLLRQCALPVCIEGCDVRSYHAYTTHRTVASVCRHAVVLHRAAAAMQAFFETFRVPNPLTSPGCASPVRRRSSFLRFAFGFVAGRRASTACVSPRCGA